MTKAVIDVGWDKYVVDLDDAVAYMRIMDSAERYASKGYGEEETHHVWEEPERGRKCSISLLPDTLYQAAKLAGKPEKK